MTRIDAPVRPALDVLHEIATEHLAPSDALERLRALRCEYPDARLDLVWDHQFDGGPRYHLLLDARPAGTITLSYDLQRDVPFTLQGAQRWREAELLSVDGRRLWMHEAMIALDALWDETRLLERLVDACLLSRHLEDEAIEVEASRLQAAMDTFRARHGLWSPRATEQWLLQRGMTVGDLEAGLERDLALDELRRRRVGALAEARYHEDPSRFDRVSVVAFIAHDTDEAHEHVARIRAGASLFEVAESALGEARDRPRTARSVIFETLWRNAIVPLDGEPLEPGRVFAGALQDRGPYVAMVRAVRPSAWDEATREAVEREAFARWLEDARSRAHVEWNWGRGS